MLTNKIMYFTMINIISINSIYSVVIDLKTNYELFSLKTTKILRTNQADPKIVVLIKNK